MMKRCTVIVVMLAVLVLATATPADACRRLFRCKARVTYSQQSADTADAGVTDGQTGGTPGTISPKPATEDDAAGPAGEDDIIDVDPDATAPAKRAAEEESAVPAPPSLPPQASNVREQPMRRWVDNTGEFSVNARLAAIGEGLVRLFKEDGRYCTVPMGRLSQADVAYVELQVVKPDRGTIVQLAGR